MKLVLIGNLQRKFDFLRELKAIDYRSADKFVHFAGVQIWPLLWDEVVPDEADVFLYLGVDGDFKAEFERQRDTNRCIGVDFNTRQLSPILCLEEIKNLKAFYDVAKEEAMKKVGLILVANEKDDTSSLHSSSLHKELALQIAGSLWRLTNSNGFFAIPHEKPSQTTEQSPGPTIQSVFR